MTERHTAITAAARSPARAHTTVPARHQIGAAAARTVEAWTAVPSTGQVTAAVGGRQSVTTFAGTGQTVEVTVPRPPPPQLPPGVAIHLFTPRVVDEQGDSDERQLRLLVFDPEYAWLTTLFGAG